MTEADFQEMVYEQARPLWRTMPWRENTDPYYVLVSEIMLQQTQVERVLPKFEQFIATFPTVQGLAGASLAEVLSLWSGLGYNRRAKFLHAAAGKIVHEFGGTFPCSLQELVSLPGVGANTAGAILAYSFNEPSVFIETNIRTVYFHHFFDDSSLVNDKELREKVAATLDREQPRAWYWALMDYGTYLKKQGAGRLDKSAHYKKQSPLAGSVREIRGKIIKQLTQGPKSEAELATLIPHDERFEPALQGLLRDGLIEQAHESDGRFQLAGLMR